MSDASHRAPRASILLVEDDEDLRVALADNLEDEGFRVRSAATGARAREFLDREGPDLIILDIMLPDTDGYEWCRRARAAGSRAPILMLTARTLEDDLVRGFGVGADDYLTKPYRLRELLARVHALLRRGAAAVPQRFEFAGFALDLESRTLFDPEGAEIPLTRTEFDLLALFLANPGQALSRRAILDAVWGVDVIVDGRTVDNFVSSLKRKLNWHERAAFRIRTVRGVGYRMEVD